MITPFQMFIKNGFPFIENTYEALDNYGLLCKIVEKLNEVISSENTLTTEMQELQNSFITLKNYVDNYFANLDVQEEINTKLDDMVEDGTMDEIINQEIFGEINSEIGDLTELDTTDKTSLVNAINEILTTVTTAIENQNTNISNKFIELSQSVASNFMNNIRKKYNNNYTAFSFPTQVDFFKNVAIYQDSEKGNYNYYFDTNNLKNSGGNTLYVDTSAGSNGSGTSESPYNRIVNAINVASSGDTIIIKNNIISRDKISLSTNQKIAKNINIVGENYGKVVIVDGDSLSWSQNSTYTNVYQATRSNIVNVIDIRDIQNGNTSKLIQTSSLEECSNKQNSYYYYDTTIYVNIGKAVTNNDVACLLNTSRSYFNFIPDSANFKIYLENIIFLNGNQAMVKIENYNSYVPTVICKNCDFLYGTETTENAITVKGAQTIFYKCKACFSNKDGFNYVTSNGIAGKNIEIDCIGAYNGLGSSANNNNGSTAHNGVKVLRINGKYFGNKGGNVADVQENTLSYNFDCIAYDSKSSASGASSNCDFTAQQAGTTMYLYNCISAGSKSDYNVVAVEGTNLYVSNCKYDTSDGTITEI